TASKQHYLSRETRSAPTAAVHTGSAVALGPVRVEGRVAGALQVGRALRATVVVVPAYADVTYAWRWRAPTATTWTSVGTGRTFEPGPELVGGALVLEVSASASLLDGSGVRHA